MGRHSAPSETRRKPVAPIAAAAALALIGLGGGGYAALRHHDGDSAPAGASSSLSPDNPGQGGQNGSDVPVTPAESAAPGKMECAKGSSVTVSTTPDMAPTVRALADQLKAQGSDCVTYNISELPSGVQVDRVVHAKKEAPQIWVPDSPVWLEEYNEGTKAGLQYGPVVATSPVGMILPKTFVDKGAPPGAFTWASMLESRSHAVTPAMSDPEYSTASLLMLASAKKAATDANQANAIKSEVMLMAQNPRNEAELMQLAASGSPEARAFPASEQQMLTEHKSSPDQKVSAVTVTGSTPQFLYGVIPTSQDDAVRQAADALRSALASDVGKSALTTNGFRVPGTPSETAASTVPGLDMSAAGTLLKPPTKAEVDAVDAAWAAVHRKMRLILAVDASNSMSQKIDGNSGMSRIQLASGISLQALKELPNDTEVGVWAFSDQNRGKGKPWVEVASILPLSAKTPSGLTHREDLVHVAELMPTLPEGGTALYDTILDAARRVQDSYDPKAVNSVVVWTDGVNRDAATISKEELLTQLKAIATSAKPVRVVLVGMGQASDMGTLREIAKASGGSAFYAYNPNDVKAIIAGALTARIEAAGSH